jgi:transketolase
MSREHAGGGSRVTTETLTASEVDLDRLAVDTVRVLAMDAIQKAGSGHPGTAMALAPAAYVLWTRFLKFDPADPEWPDRDRFVLSNGHASVLQYAVLHLTGYPLTIRDLKQQRQWGSQTPGHPEYGHTPGVEVTTGPLGQGVGNGVGFAMAERLLAARYNRPGQELVDHRTWVFCGDGDLMEGVSAEASSLAGHLRLGKLCVLYDDNQITIDGPTSITFTEDVVKRYEAYGWHTVQVEDANDVEAIAAAYQAAVDETERPSFIRLRSIIAWGAPNAQGTSKAHGAALGEDEVRATKQVYGWNPDKHFKVPDGVPERWQARVVQPTRRRGRPGSAACPPTPRPSRSWPPSSRPRWPASSPRAGTPTWTRRSPSRPRWPPARRPSGPSTPSPPTCPPWSGVRPTWPSRI